MREALRQMVHQREDADAKLEQRWHNTLKEESVPWLSKHAGHQDMFN